MTASLLKPSQTTPGVTTSLGEGPFAVTTHGLVKRFGRDTALAGIDLQAPEGAVYVLAGANGAGKSTLLRILLNLVRPDAGDSQLLGRDPRRSGPELRAQIGYVPEGLDTGYRWFRAGRLLEHHAVFYPAWDPAYAARLCQVFDVRPDREVRHLSKGQARRLQLVLALAHRPPVLLLDEPTDGLDPVARDEVLGILSEHLSDTGCTVLLSTHRVYEVDRIADHIGVLRDGKLVAQVSRAGLHDMLRAYRAEGPPGWQAPADLPGAILRRSGSGREMQWTVWGHENEVVERIARSGGVVRNVAPLSLDEAVVTLLRAEAPC